MCLNKKIQVEEYENKKEQQYKSTLMLYNKDEKNKKITRRLSIKDEYHKA